MEVFHQKWGYYLHQRLSISNKRLRIDAQIYKSGGSGDGGGIFRHLAKDVFEILGYRSAERIDSEIFGITRKLKRRLHSRLGKIKDN